MWKKEKLFIAFQYVMSAVTKQKIITQIQIVQLYKSEFMKYNKKLNYEKVDRFISVIEVNQKIKKILQISKK